MMRGVLILLGVSVLAAIAWFAWQTGGGPSAPDDLVLGGPPAARGVQEEARPGDPSGENPVPQAPIEARPFSPPVTEVDQPAGIEESPAAGVTVEVVRRDDGTPAAGAIVSWLSPPSKSPLRNLRDLDRRGGPMAILRAHGRRFRAGQDGRVVVPFPEGETILFAEREGEGGLARMVAASGEIQRVEIVADPPLRIRVQDGDGHPVAGIPVVVGPQNVGMVPLSRAETDSGGDALFEHVRMLGFLDEQKAFAVWLPLTLLERVERTFQLDALPSDPIVLTLPPCGSVVVTVEEADGSPCERNCRVVLTPAGGNPDLSQMFMGEAVEGGRVRFPFVEVGMDLVVEARAESGGKPATTTAAGPAAVGEEVRLSVRFSDDETFLVGRILDAEGAPICNEPIGRRLTIERSGSSSSSSGRFETDAEGRFGFALGDSDWDVDATRTLMLAADSAWNLGDRPRAEIDLSFDLPAGRHELGDIRLLDPPILVTGTVLGSGGEPIQGARVVPEWRRTYGEPGTESFGEWWEPGYEHRDETDAKGRFRLAGRTEEAEFRISASADGYIQDEQPLFTPGTREVKIILRRGASLLGSVLLDEGITAHSVDVSWGVGEEPERWDSSSTSLASDGTFKLDGLAPGQGTFYVHVEGTPRPLVEIKDVAVLDGQENRDARLQGIDLRGKLHQIKITVVAENDRPLEGVMIHQRTGPNSSSGSGLSGDMTYEAVVGPEGGSFTVEASGCVEVHLKGVRTDQRVVMRTTPPVRVLLLGIDIPEEPFGINVSLEAVVESSEGEESRPFHGGLSAEIAADGVAVFESISPGRYKVGITWIRRSGNGWTGTGVDMEPPAFISVADTGVEQMFQVAVSREAVKRARERLR